MRITLLIIGLALVAFAGVSLILFKQGLDSYLYANSLTSVAVAAPDGWETASYQSSHGQDITGTLPEPEAEVSETTNNILLAFEAAASGIDDGVVHLFIRDEERIAFRMRQAPFVKKRISLAERLGRALPEEVVEIRPEDIIGTLDNVPFIIGPRVSETQGEPVPTPVNYRYITAVVGDPEVDETVEIAILTNSSDAAVAAVIASLDMAGVVERMSVPATNVLAGQGFVNEWPKPLSDEPPTPTVAYQALALLEGPKVFDELSEEVLTRVRDGDIADFDVLLAEYPDLQEIAFEVLDVLKNGSATNAARYYALVLANSGRDWNNSEYYVLSQIAKAGTTQESLADFLGEQSDVAPEVLALVDRLPEVGPEEVVEPEPEPEARINDGGSSSQIGSENCTIQNGVRRCVVGND